jgi:hypothetical protein
MTAGQLRTDLRALLRHGERPAHVHNAFRFPARLHHRVSREIITAFTRRTSVVCDPFTGSGTNQIEAAVAGRSSVGFDVDPLSIFITKTKLCINSRNAKRLEKFYARVESRISRHERSGAEYERLAFHDLGDRRFKKLLSDIEGDALTIFERWFRKYVIIDLAHIKNAIRSVEDEAPVKALAMLAFASIIRNCSNADPVPVSGLEYTKRMRLLDAEGRIVNPFEQFRKKFKSLTNQALEFAELRSVADRHRVYQRDSTARWRLDGEVDLVFCSPPYLNAVEYSRRHKLEMYWLGLVQSDEEFRRLSRRYIGRRSSSATAIEGYAPQSTLVQNLIKRVESSDPGRARAFTLYCRKIEQFLSEARIALKRRGRCIVVIGDTRAAGVPLPLHKVVRELASDYRHLETFSYGLRDRYMTYSRHNGASIDREHVVILEK